MERKRLFKNAALLTATGFLLRGMGMALRVYMSGRVGSEGMGLYQLINSVYFLFLTLAQAGVSVTVTRRCSEKLVLHDGAGAYRVFRSALAVALTTGGAAGAALLFGGGALAGLWIGDPRAAASLRLLSPSLPLCAVSSVFSAYFVAEKNVIYGCEAQIAEQLTRMGAAWAVLSLLSGRDVGVTLSAVCLTTTLAEAVSCLWLRTAFRRTHIRPKNARAGLSGVIVKESAPVAASRILSSALHTAENMLVPSAAAVCEGSRAAALGAFGDLKGMALPLLLFPSSFLSALSTLLVPEVAEGGTARLVSRSARITLEFGFCAAGVFFLFGGELGALIYHSARAGRYLRVLSVIVPFMYLDGICDGLLKGMGLQTRRLVHGCIDSGSRILLVACLLPRFGMDGFLGVMVFSNVLSALLGYVLLVRRSHANGALSAFLSPAARCAVSAFFTKILTPDSAILTKTLLGSALFCLFFALSGVALALITQKIQK